MPTVEEGSRFSTPLTCAIVCPDFRKVIMNTIENADIHRVTIDDREFVLVGTAHISQESVETVKAVIREENPDTVCVELDEQRHRALRNPRHWESLNLIQVLKQGQAPFLLANLALSSFQKRMGLQTGVKPGAELAAAAEMADGTWQESRTGRP